MPEDTTSLMPSSTLSLVRKISVSGTSSKKPEVGLGVVGTKTLNRRMPWTTWHAS